MIGKGLFHRHLVVRYAAKSVEFYTGLFGMEQVDFKDGTLVVLTTPGRDDLLVLNPGGEWGYPGGCAKERPCEEKLAGVQGGVSHFGYMLPSAEEYERAIASVEKFGGRWLCVATTAVHLRTPISPILTDTSSRSNMDDEATADAHQEVGSPRASTRPT